MVQHKGVRIRVFRINNAIKYYKALPIAAYAYGDSCLIYPQY